MPTPTDIGIDVVGLAAPLVDLGFGLAGNARVTALVSIAGVRVVNAGADTVSETGGYSVSVPAILYQRSEQDGGELAAIRESTLMLNASDLVAAGVPVGIHPKTNDKVVINGDSWTVFGLTPIPTNVIYLLRIRR